MVPGIHDDIIKDLSVDEPINELQVFDGQSDDLGIIFKIEDHVVNEINEEDLDVNVLVVKVVVDIYFDLF